MDPLCSVPVCEHLADKLAGQWLAGFSRDELQSNRGTSTGLAQQRSWASPPVVGGPRSEFRDISCPHIGRTRSVVALTLLEQLPGHAFSISVLALFPALAGIALGVTLMSGPHRGVSAVAHLDCASCASASSFGPKLGEAWWAVGAHRRAWGCDAATIRSAGWQARAAPLQLRRLLSMYGLTLCTLWLGWIAATLLLCS